MTRPIKFRAWDKKERKMLHVMKLNFDYDAERFNHLATAVLDGRWGIAEAVEFGEKRVRAWNGEERKADNLELMQFTGLLDKNGKEIYESDRVQIVGYGKKDWIVKWNELSAGFILATKKGNWHDIGGCTLEVVGNEYES